MGASMHSSLNPYPVLSKTMHSALHHKSSESIPALYWSLIYCATIYVGIGALYVSHARCSITRVYVLEHRSPVYYHRTIPVSSLLPTLWTFRLVISRFRLHMCFTCTFCLL